MKSAILCPIDLTESSRETVQWAVTMAQQLNAHLTILYTYRLLHNKNGEALHLKKQMEEDAHERFKLFEEELLIGRSIPYDFKTEIGFVTDRIEDHAKKNALSFLIMNKNISNNKENFDNLMEHLLVPLLLIP